MDYPLSKRSDLKRIDAAAALASCINGEDVRVFSFTDQVKEVAARPGLAGIDAILNSQPRGGTMLGKAVERVNGERHDRLIVVTDEQTADSVPAPMAKHAYMINVASYRNGVGYGKWVHLDGFSERVLRYIPEYERAFG